MRSTSFWTVARPCDTPSFFTSSAVRMGGSAVTSTADLSQVKLAMLRQLDSTLRQNYHQSLIEVLNELRMRSVVCQPDPTPDKVFSIILQTHMLTYKPAPSVLRLRDALERMESGTFGLCVRCGREISVDTLLSDPTVSCCTICQARANG
jgi:RNA polymerase-binding transcription factor DksA